MMAVGDCPPEELLRGFLLGLLPDEEIARQTAHLDACATCLELAKRITADDWLVDSLRSPGTPELWAEPDDEILIERLRQQGRRLPRLADDTLHDVPQQTPSLPGYEVFEVIGRGGMGVVFRARQIWPRRIVAVKMVRLDSRPERLARFRSEITAAARFIHPNVVSVYEVGDHQGVPYFSMEYAAGGSLAHRLARGPLPAREAAETLLTLARAVNFGHDCGVVHRDLKPSNILVSGEWSVTGRGRKPDSSRGEEASNAGSLPATHHSTPVTLKIADFGLAKCLDEHGQTLTGELLGTPAYMAPELTQAGEREDLPAADIYSLGAILYECLTRRPPFQGETPFATLEQVRTQDPASPRRIQAGIPRDLETICLKCLARQPARRYASAAALADDLERYLEGRPILARPVGSVERAAKWLRRHPAISTFAAGLLALFAGGIVYEQRLQRALTLAENNAAQARQEKDRADANYKEARQALYSVLQKAKDRSASSVPRLHELQRRQSEAALAFYHNVASQMGESPQVRYDRAWAQRDAALLELELGRNKDALQNLTAARTTFASLAEAYPKNLEIRYGLASSLLALTGVDFAHAEESSKETMRLCEQLTTEAPDKEEYAAALASACHQTAIHENVKNRPKEAIHLYERAIELRQAALKRRPGNQDVRIALAQDRINLSHLCCTQGQKQRGEQLHDEAEAELAVLVEDAPNVVEIELAWAVLRINWAYALWEKKQLAAAIADLGKNAERLLALVKQEPTSEPLREHLFRTFGLRAQLNGETGAFAAAVKDQRQAIEFAPNEQLRRERHFFLALDLANAGKYGEAVTQVDELAKTMPPDASEAHWVHLANVCGIAANKAGADKALDDKTRAAAIDRAVSLGLDCVRKARGKTPLEQWRGTLLELAGVPNFHPLAKDPRWKELGKE